MEYEWFLARNYELGVMFEVLMKPFIDFCKKHGHRSNQLIMKIAARLSGIHLPQYMLALNGRPYPARYPAGYVRPVRLGADMLEHIGIRESEGRFSERNVRGHWKLIPRWVAHNAPRLAVKLARYFPREEVKDNYALMVSRNPLKSLNTKVLVIGSHLRTMSIAIPFGEKVICTFISPHAFGNINFFEPFLRDFKNYMENPGLIPAELLNKPYSEAPQEG